MRRACGSEKADDGTVVELRKSIVEAGDAQEEIGSMETDEFVAAHAEAFGDVMRRNWHGNHDMVGAEMSNIGRSDFHGVTRSNTVIDHDGGFACKVGKSLGFVALPSPLCLVAFLGDDFAEMCAADAGGMQGVEYDATELRERANRVLGIMRVADLANRKNVEGET